MKRNIVKLISIILVITQAIFVFYSCAKKNTPVNPDGSSTEAQTTPKSVDTTDQPNEESPILADLNNDGTDDKITIKYDNENKTSATIVITNGADNSQLMSDTLILNENRIGAYYLKKGKQNEPDQLVLWYYSHLMDNARLSFTYMVFSYDKNGKIKNSAYGDKTFGIGVNDNIEAEDIVFQTMLETINEHTQPTFLYTGYLLLDNQGDKITFSTAENLLEPQKLTFHLSNFAKR